MKHQHLIKLVLYHTTPPSSSSKICDYSLPPTLPSLRRRRTAIFPRSPPIRLPTSLINGPPLSATHNPMIILRFPPNFPPCQPAIHKHMNSTQSLYRKPSSFLPTFQLHHSCEGKLMIFSKERVFPKSQKALADQGIRWESQKLPCCECEGCFWENQFFSVPFLHQVRNKFKTKLKGGKSSKTDRR